MNHDPDPLDAPAVAEVLFSVNLSEKQLWRFWKKVEKGGPCECWNWNACKNELGYGNLNLFGKSLLAHRVAFAISKGAFRSSLKVCHSCDNPSCCNPSHLWLGTDADNVADRDAKGRLVKGKTFHGGSHVNAKLTDEQVSEIRALYAFGEWLHRELGEKYGVSRGTIQRIVTGARWKHLL